MLVGMKYWEQRRAFGIELLKKISTDDAELQTVLGPDYPMVMATFFDREPTTSSLAAQGTQKQSSGPSNAVTDNVQAADSERPAKRRRT